MIKIEGALISRDLVTQVKRIPGNMCVGVFVFSPRTSGKWFEIRLMLDGGVVQQSVHLTVVVLHLS